MASRNHSGYSAIRILATDLDGTFLPLDDAPEHHDALRRLGEYFGREGHQLIFVTGRHFASVEDAMARYRTPRPDRIICDVGTSIYRPTPDGEAYHEVRAYREHLDERTARLPLGELEPMLRPLDGLRRQEEPKQGPHKLSYYTDGEAVDDRVEAIEMVIRKNEAPFTVVGSVDPFNGDGLIDVLPQDVNKAHALDWLGKQERFSADEMVFSGDSGNDLAALTAGQRAILVGNATDRVKALVRRRMGELDRSSLLYVTEASATSGVLEGCRHFGAEIPG